MNNSTLFLIIAIAIMAAFSFALTIIDRKKTADGELPEELHDIASAKKVSLLMLARVGLKLFTDAERKYGASTGQLKMSSVVAEFLQLLPEWARSIIDGEWLSTQLERYLELAKEKWLANPALLGKKDS